MASAEADQGRAHWLGLEKVDRINLPPKKVAHPAHPCSCHPLRQLWGPRCSCCTAPPPGCPRTSAAPQPVAASEDFRKNQSYLFPAHTSTLKGLGAIANWADGQNLRRKWVTHSESESCRKSQEILNKVFKELERHKVDRPTLIVSQRVDEAVVGQSNSATLPGRKTTSPERPLLIVSQDEKFSGDGIADDAFTFSFSFCWLKGFACWRLTAANKSFKFHSNGKIES